MVSTERIEEQKSRALKTLATMLDYLGLEAALKCEEKGSKIIILISSEEAGRIIGRKGQSLESLQVLLNRMMFKNDPEFPRIVLDIDGYSRGSKRRGDDQEGASRGGSRRHSRNHSSSDEEQLTKQAIDASKEVKRWGESVVLPKMNSHDRRIIHITLQDDPEIITESEGEGKLKNVVISLKK
jgi:spoIIIJ-associated protein